LDQSLFWQSEFLLGLVLGVGLSFLGLLLEREELGFNFLFGNYAHVFVQNRGRLSHLGLDQFLFLCHRFEQAVVFFPQFTDVFKIRSQFSIQSDYRSLQLGDQGLLLDSKPVVASYNVRNPIFQQMTEFHCLC
jgi:hypothetical protein